MCGLSGIRGGTSFRLFRLLLRLRSLFHWRFLRLEQVTELGYQEAQASFGKRAGNVDKQGVVNLFVASVEDDGDSLVFLPDGLGNQAAGHPGHRVIEDHRVKLYLLKKVDRVPAALRSYDVETLSFQHYLKRMENCWFIIYAQDYELDLGHLVPIPTDVRISSEVSSFKELQFMSCA